MKNLSSRLRALGVPEIFEERTASREDYTAEGGVNFSVDHREFTRFLAKSGYRGPQMGAYLRGEEPVTDDMLKDLVKKYNAKIRRGPRPSWMPKRTPGRRKKLPYLSDLWEKLIQAVFKTGEDNGAGGVKDMFLMMRSNQEMDEFYSYLQNVSADVSMSWEYALEGRAEKLYEKYMDLLDSGEYEAEHDRSLTNRRSIKNRLSMAFSEGWFEGSWISWEKLSAKEKARLQAMRV